MKSIGIGVVLLAFLLVWGCEKKEAEVSPTPQEGTEAPKAEGAKPEATPEGEAKAEAQEGAEKAAEGEAEAAEAPEPPPSGPGLHEAKDMLGLQLKPFGKWKPVWDAEAKVAKWANDKFINAIVIRLVDEKLDTIDDLKKAAPNMMQLGSDITKIVKKKKTPKGWWAVVKRDKETEFVYIQKHDEKQLVCSANLTKKKGSIPQKLAMKACGSIKVKK